MEANKTTLQWQLEGNSAEAYEQYLVSGMFKPWAEQLIKLAGLSEGEHLLDFACGTFLNRRNNNSPESSKKQTAAWIENSRQYQ